MRTLSITAVLLTALFMVGLVAFGTNAQGFGKAGNAFVDADGDGFNDNAPDADGDGIPNGQDPDYTGAKTRNSGNAKGFVDENGDGVNDNALDADADGIPNGQDPDFVKPLDGTGQKHGKMGMRGKGRGFVDADGDGINDLALDADGDGIPNCQDDDYVPVNGGNVKARRAGRSGRNAGSGNASLAPARDRLQDGSCGTGICDGTGIGRKTRRMGR